MSEQGWNHNDHYLRLVIDATPSPCARALDVGCGRGMLARRLADRCAQVTGIDADEATVAAAARNAPSNVTLVHGDVMTYPLEQGSFDMVTAVASLHHLPLEAALVRFRDLLRPGGVLAVVGLYRPQSAFDYLSFAAALPVSRAMRSWRGTGDVGAPLKAPSETLGEVRTAAAKALPGAVVRRLFLFRYFLVWEKPG